MFYDLSLQKSAGRWYNGHADLHLLLSFSKIDFSKPGTPRGSFFFLERDTWVLEITVGNRGWRLSFSLSPFRTHPA